MKKRSLRPKEHGAYGQIGLPLAAALLAGRPSLAGGLLSLGAGLAFASYEPVNVALGHRGPRAQTNHGARARRRALGLGVTAIACGGAGLLLGGIEVATAAAVPLALALGLLPWVLRGRAKTLSGEVLAGACLSAAALPVAIAGGTAASLAVAAWLAWSLAFAITTSTVRRVIATAKGRPHRAEALVLGLSSLGLVATALVAPVAWAMSPLLVASWWLALRPPPVRRLKRVGWTLVAFTVVAALALAALVRLSA
ncbi:MAG: YwiC-like family protein [Myxococcota bacterium]